MSSGSVTVDTTLVKTESGQRLNFSAIRYFDEEAGGFDGLTVAEFSSKLIESNVGFVEGMEFAIIAVVAPVNNPRFGAPIKFYIVLDRTNTATTVGDMMGNVKDFIEFNYDNEGLMSLVSASGDYYLMGAACIVSKRGASSWKNTNSRFVPTAVGEQYFYTQALYDAALATYGKAGSTLESDLFLQQADNAADALNPKAVVSVESLAIELKDEFADAQLSAANVGVAVTRAGERMICTQSNGQLCTNEGVGITITVTESGSQVTSPLMLDQTKLEGNKTIVWGSF